MPFLLNCTINGAYTMYLRAGACRAILYFVSGVLQLIFWLDLRVQTETFGPVLDSQGLGKYT